MSRNIYFNEEPLEDQIIDLLADQMLGNDRTIIEEEVDEFKNGVGPFGLSPANPIPVNGPTGESVYLNSLRSNSGARFLYHRLGSCLHPVSRHPIDIFELLATDGSQNICIFISMYHPRRSRLLPEGFKKSVLWNDLNSYEQILYKKSFYGQNIYVPNFPCGLPNTIEGRQELRDIEPNLDLAMANAIREILINLEKEGLLGTGEPKFNSLANPGEF